MTGTLVLEGVNFDTTLLDTNDLRTVTGSSDLLDRLPINAIDALEDAGFSIDTDAAETGGSRLVLNVGAEDGPKMAKHLRTWIEAHKVYRHMSVFVAYDPDPVEGEARARASVRIAQAQNWSIPPFDVVEADKPDQLDQVRPATEEVTKARGSIIMPASASVHARREVGRRERASLFDTELAAQWKAAAERLETLQTLVDRTTDDQRDRSSVKGKSGSDLLPALTPHDFGDLVGAPLDPRASGSKHARVTTIRETIRHKLAVVHLDGDKFGSSARAAKSRGEGQAFDARVKTMMASIRNALVLSDTNAECILAKREQDNEHFEPFLRLQKFIWGGEDITLAGPAWRIFEMLRAFYGGLDGHYLDDGKQTPTMFTAGVVIANFRTPVRQLVGLAETSVALAKDSDHGRGRIAFDIFESEPPPREEQGGLLRFRRGYLPEDEVKHGLSLAPGDLAKYQTALSRIADQTEDQMGMTRTLMHRLLNAARPGRDPATWYDEAAEKRVLEAAARRARRRDGGSPEDLLRELAPDGSSTGHPVLDLLRASRLIDYAAPYSAGSST